jgi:hypothetical protein
LVTVELIVHRDRGNPGLERIGTKLFMERNFALTIAVKEADRAVAKRTKVGVPAYLCFLAAMASGMACLSFVFMAWLLADQRLVLGGIGMLVSTTGWILMGSHFRQADLKRARESGLDEAVELPPARR